MQTFSSYIDEINNQRRQQFEKEYVVEGCKVPSSIKGVIEGESESRLHQLNKQPNSTNLRDDANLAKSCHSPPSSMGVASIDMRHELPSSRGVRCDER